MGFTEHWRRGDEVDIGIEVLHVILWALTCLIAYLLELVRRPSEKITAHYFLGGRSPEIESWGR